MQTGFFGIITPVFNVLLQCDLLLYYDKILMLNCQ